MRLRNRIIAIALMLIVVGASAQTDLSMSKRHQNIAAVASLTAKGDIDQLKTALAPMMNFFPFAQIETISPRPVLFIAGEKAVSRYFSEDAYARAAEPKELFIVPNATHVDLYDQPEYLSITLPKLDSFFKEYLK